MNTASNFTQFTAALASWHAPTQNFVYADAAGHIGVIAPGYYPQVPQGCQPWLPMPGAGACDIDGVIPYAAVPQSYDPPGHLIATDNQRPVGPDYPYYVGTALDFYDPGYRAARAYSALRAAEPLTPAKIAALQNDLTDPLAQRIVPVLLKSVGGLGLPSDPRQAAQAGAWDRSLGLLKAWNGSMDEDSAAASIWWTFWSSYLDTVFAPWWQAGKVPVSEHRLGLAITPNLAPLDEDLEAWTLSDPGNKVFAGPDGHGPGNASAAMAIAFKKTVTHLEAKLGGAPDSWTWGKLHTREFPALTGAPGLGYGPRAAGGDPFTEDAADGTGLNATAGPSWRMIAALGSTASTAPALVPDSVPGPAPGGVYAVGVYPGGQSENPASPWYENLTDAWWNGEYLAVPVPGRPAGPATWTLHG